MTRVCSEHGCDQIVSGAYCDKHSRADRPRAHPPAEWYLAITKIGHNTFVVTQRDLHDVEVFSMTGTYASVERIIPLLLNTKAMP